MPGFLVGSVLLALLAFLVWSIFFSPPPNGMPWPDEFWGQVPDPRCSAAGDSADAHRVGLELQHLLGAQLLGR
jgi:hypothetical protein